MKPWALPVIVLGFLALHIGMAALIPLVEDEAYYALWASRPAFGYYDHPPMIAWWIWLGEQGLGRTTLGVRLLPLLASALITLATYRVACLLTDDRRTGLWAAFWVNSMTLFAALSFIATPDAPSALFWTASVWALAELLKRKNANWWLAVGLFAGLGVQSKFTNLFFGVGLVLWILLSVDGRRWLTRWQLWAGGFVACLAMAPLVWWNELHDWVGLERQFGRIEADGFALAGVAEFVLSTILLVSPLLFWLVLRGVRRSGRAGAFLIWVSAPFVIYLVYHGTQASVQGNWLLPIYPSLAVIASLSLRREGPGWVEKAAGPLGLATTALVLALALWPGVPVFPGHNPLNQTKGWEDVGPEIEELAAQNDARWIATGGYGLTGQLHHYISRNLPVWQINEPKRYLFRGAFPQSLCGEKALVVVRRNQSDAALRHFVSVVDLGTVTRSSKGAALVTYQVFLAQGLVDPVWDTCLAD